MIASVAQASAKAPFIFSVHSFTPAMQGVERPWHVGILWDLDDRVARPLIDMLAEDKTLIVEIRQDLISDQKGALAWAERLAPIVDAIDRRPDIHQVKMFGSRTGPL